MCPLLTARGIKLKAEPVPEVKSDNPSSGSIHVRPSGVMTSTGSSNWTVEEMMSELDSPANMPEGLELYQWERFIIARHYKVESERRVSNRVCVCVCYCCTCTVGERDGNEVSRNECVLA